MVVVASIVVVMVLMVTIIRATITLVIEINKFRHFQQNLYTDLPPHTATCEE